MEAFKAWADGEGYDTAHNYDTEHSRWVFFNPMTADLWKCWQAASSNARAQVGNVPLTDERAPISRDHRALPDELTHYPPTVNALGSKTLLKRAAEVRAYENAEADAALTILGAVAPTAPHLAALVLRLNELWNEQASEDRIADQLGMCRVIAEHIARVTARAGG